MTHAETLAAMAREFQAQGFKVEVHQPDPPTTLVPYMNVWANHTERYPAETIWAPSQQEPCWTWGWNLQKSAPADTSSTNLTRMLKDTLASARPPAGQ
ncbi:Uncharacterised protein [Mycobacteroides abscessus subsp. abscessus]|uniref:hypothetical protein n=1 Tax=Mycobacteroides abscessus TaxID=36809 RepID=UPI00092B749C|nr:hypothetical protein [Mycobacteroides abscessus]SIH24026.1 Uncharacterised protein [Mycobacteroides abscessus subsp. abscessus]